MALQTFGGGLLYPPPEYGMASNNSPDYEADLLLDADGEKWAFVFRAPKAGDLSKVRFRTKTVTTGDTLKISFQDVDATDGDPDEVVDQSVTQVIGDGDDDTGFYVTMGSNRTVAKDELCSLVVEFNSYVAGNLNLLGRYALNPVSRVAEYYLTQKDGTWTKDKIKQPAFSIEYSDGSYAWLPWSSPSGDITTTTFNSGSTPDEIGNKITLPFPATCIGLWAYVDGDNAFDLVLYDDSDTARMTISMDSDVRAATACQRYERYASSTWDIPKDTAYRVMIKPGASNITAYDQDLVAAAAQDQMIGGQNVLKSSRTDAGGWTDDTSNRIPCGLILGAFDDGIGGGGGLVASGLVGP
jgi:hypothetical protein